MTQMYTIRMEEITSVDQVEPLKTGVVETNDLGVLIAMVQATPYHMILFSRTEPYDLTFMSFPSLFHVMALWSTYEAKGYEEEQEAHNADEQSALPS